MVPITTYQSMCSDVLCEGRAIVSPYIHANASCSSSKQHSSRLLLSKSKCNKPPKKPPNEPIPLYFAWNRLDPSYTDEEDGTDKHRRHDGRQEGRPPPQCQIDDEREKPQNRAKVKPVVAASSHHFLVDPDVVQDEEPFITEYADKYRAWTIPVKEKAKTKRNKGQGQRHKSSDGDRGVELALRGMAISQTPPRTQNQRPPLSTTTDSSSSRRQPSVSDGLIITCDNTRKDSSGMTKKSSEIDEQSCLTGTTATTAPSTPAGGSSYDADVEDGSIPSTTSTPLTRPAPTPAKSTEDTGDIWLITSGNCIKKRAPTQHQSTKLTKLRETRRDMPFWKSSSSSPLGIPISTTPNHSVSKGKARRFGEKSGINNRSAHIRSNATAATCPSPQKLSRMLLTSRRGLSSAKLFPRLPNDPFRKDALKRKV